jgi:hypothetical protein
VGGGSLAGKGSAGFRLGILGSLKDYPELHDFRNNLWPIGPSGIAAGISADGSLFIGRIGQPAAVKLDLAREAVDLHLAVAPAGESYEAGAHRRRSARRESARADEARRHPQRNARVGNIALVCNFPAADGGSGGGVATKGKAKAKAVEKGAAVGPGPGLGQFWFSDWRVGGTKIAVREAQTFGPILWSQYTLHAGVLKLSAHRCRRSVPAMWIRCSSSFRTARAARGRPRAKRKSMPMRASCCFASRAGMPSATCPIASPTRCATGAVARSISGPAPCATIRWSATNSRWATSRATSTRFSPNVPLRAQHGAAQPRPPRVCGRPVLRELRRLRHAALAARARRARLPAQMVFPRLDVARPHARPAEHLAPRTTTTSTRATSGARAARARKPRRKRAATSCPRRG